MKFRMPVAISLGHATEQQPNTRKLGLQGAMELRHNFVAQLNQVKFGPLAITAGNIRNDRMVEDLLQPIAPVFIGLKPERGVVNVKP